MVWITRDDALEAARSLFQLALAPVDLSQISEISGLVRPSFEGLLEQPPRLLELPFFEQN
jgi:hypothetical protein